MPLTFEEICRRAGGRRRYNCQRQDAARARREQVSALLVVYGEGKHGAQARIARELGVSEATISRDVFLIKLRSLSGPALHKLIRHIWPLR